MYTDCRTLPHHCVDVVCVGDHDPVPATSVALTVETIVDGGRKATSPHTGSDEEPFDTIKTAARTERMAG